MSHQQESAMLSSTSELATDFVRMSSFASGALKRAVETARRRLAVAYSSSDIDMLLRSAIGHLPYEVMAIVSLDAGYRAIGFDIVGLGSPSEVGVPSYVVVSAAVSRGASYVIVAHNHPNGYAEPSEGDLKVCALQKVWFGVVGIGMVDWMVVSSSEATSLLERRQPAHCWPAVGVSSSEDAQRCAEATIAAQPPMSDEDKEAYSAARAILGHITRSRYAALGAQWVLGAFRQWLREQPSATLSGMALHPGNIPITLEPLRADLGDLIRTFARFAVRSCGTRFLFAIPSSSESVDDDSRQLAVAVAAALHIFDLELIDILLLTPSGAMPSLREQGALG